MTRDLGAAVAEAAAAAMAGGELPGLRPPDGLPTAGSWRPVPPGAGGGPGCYATSIPFTLAGRTGADPAQVAAALAARLQPADRPRAAERRGPGGLIEAATVTGPGYLSLTVRRGALQLLAVRISQAGSACARSDALRGHEITAPRDAQLATAASWAQAARQLIAECTGRLGAAAGADVTWTEGPRPGARPRARARPRAQARPGPAYDPGSGCGRGRVRRRGRHPAGSGRAPAPGHGRTARPARRGRAPPRQSRLCCPVRARARCVRRPASR